MYFTITRAILNPSVPAAEMDHGGSLPADQFEFTAYKTDDYGNPTGEAVFGGNLGEALAAYYPDED